MKIKPVFKYGALALTVLVLGLAATFAIVFLPLQSAPAFQVYDGMHFVSDNSTIAIVPTAANQVLLVDSGMDGQASEVLAELSRMGMTRESVTAILFTHGHLDHIGGARQFPNAEKIALQSDAELIAGLAGSHGPVTRWLSVSPTGLKVDHVVRDGEAFTVGQTAVQVFAVPGHTLGSAAYLINGVLFLGDSANATSSGTLRSGVWLFCDDSGLNEASLRGLAAKLRASPGAVRAIAFGHSGVLEQGLKPLTDWADNHAGSSGPD